MVQVQLPQSAFDNLAGPYAAHIAHVSERYSAELDKAGYAALVIHAGSLVPRSRFDDQDWPFRPTPAFAHFSPLVEPDSWLVLVPGKRPRILRSYQAGFWDGPPAAIPDWAWAVVDSAEITPDALAGELPSGRLAWIGEDERIIGKLGLNIAPADQNPADLIAAFNAIRTHKTAYEVECMHLATVLSVAGHKRVFACFREKPRSELELHLEYLDAVGHDDFQTPYKNIVAQCGNAAILHHVSYSRALPPDDRSLLVDAGAVVLGYPCDISRTEVVGSGEAAGVFGEMIRRVEAMQLDICRQIRPGLPYEKLHDQCHTMLAPILREVGLVDADEESIVSTGVTRRFLPHGLGHSLGLQIHDVGCKLRPPRPDNPFLRNTSVIDPGQLFTIEPGIYFVPSMMDALRQAPLAKAVNWRLLEEVSVFGGIRIEDNVLVTGDGIRNLTREVWPAEAQ